MKVLIVEAVSGIAPPLDQYLRREGFLAELATTGREALSLFHHARPDLVLLDVMLPERDGCEVLKAIRKDGAVPVIMLTARTDEVDRLVGLGLGAADYVVKPFSFREVVARVKAVLRRAQPPTEPAARVLQVGSLSVDPNAATASFAGHLLDLTATEFKLLSQFASAPNRVFNRSELIERALPDSDILERTLDSHIKNLRAKLHRCGAHDVIQTVRGLGFRLVEAQVVSRPPAVRALAGTQVSPPMEVSA